MKKAIRYFRHIKLADRLPLVPRHYSTEYDLKAVDADEEQLLKMTAIRSPQAVELLKKRYHVQNAKELTTMLPTRHKPRRGARLMPLIRRIMGTLPYDPMKRHYHKHRRK